VRTEEGKWNSGAAACLERPNEYTKVDRTPSPQSRVPDPASYRILRNLCMVNREL